MVPLSDTPSSPGRAGHPNRHPNRHIPSFGSADGIEAAKCHLRSGIRSKKSSRTADLLPDGKLRPDYKQNASLLSSTLLLFFALGLKCTHIFEVYLSLEGNQPLWGSIRSSESMRGFGVVSRNPKFWRQFDLYQWRYHSSRSFPVLTFKLLKQVSKFMRTTEAKAELRWEKGPCRARSYVNIHISPS